LRGLVEEVGELRERETAVERQGRVVSAIQSFGVVGRRCGAATGCPRCRGSPGEVAGEAHDLGGDGALVVGVDGPHQRPGVIATLTVRDFLQPAMRVAALRADLATALRRWTPGLWVRPIDPDHEGAITTEVMRLPGDLTPGFLDIVDIRCCAHTADPTTPRTGLPTPPALAPPRPFPARATRQPPRRARAIMGQLDGKTQSAHGFVAKMLRPASLYLIRPICP